MYDAPSTVAPILLALVLGLSGIAKLRDTTTAAEAFLSLRLPTVLLRLKAPRILPWAELALAVALLVCSGALARCIALCALVLFIAYLAVILRALTFNERVSCACFGKLGLGSVDRFTAIRNALLVALAFVTVADAWKGRSVLQRLSDFGGGERLWLAGVFAAITLTWLVTGHRGEPAPAQTATIEEDEYLRVPIPIGRLRRPSNETVTLRALARTEPVLLLYVSPTCGSCITVINKARTWQHETDVVRTYLVLPGPVSPQIIGLDDADQFNILFDPESEMFNLFEMGTPMGVLLGADGRLAGGPVLGSTAVTQLMDDILDELTGADERAGIEPEIQDSDAPDERATIDAPLVSESAPASAPAEISTDSDESLEYIRHPTPYGLLTTREGGQVPVISLADTRPTILLFVSPSCGSCREVIQATPAWRQELPGISVAFVVLDEGSAEQIQALLQEPVGDLYLDPTATLRQTFAIGTPAMVALGPDRHLLAGPVNGFSGISTSMEEIVEQVRALQGREPQRDASQEQAPERPLAPEAPLQRRDGRTVSMRDHGQPRQQLLAFLSPGCDACEVLADKLPAWRAELPEVDIVAVAYGDPGSSAEYEPIGSIEDALFDVTGEFGSTLNIATPALVLIGRDGTVAGGPVIELSECLSFIERIKEMYSRAER